MSRELKPLHERTTSEIEDDLNKIVDQAKLNILLSLRDSDMGRFNDIVRKSIESAYRAGLSRALKIIIWGRQ